MRRLPPTSPSPQAALVARLRSPYGLALAAAALPALLFLAAGLLAGPLPQDRVWAHSLQSLLLAARPWLLFFGVAVQLVALACWRRWLPGLLAGAVYLVGAGLPAPEGAPRDAPGVRIVSSNVNSYTPGPPGAEVALAALQPDVLLVIERRAERVAGLDRVADNYQVPMSRISHGHAVHCRPGLACAAAITPEIGSRTSHMPVGLLRLPVPVEGGGPDRMACVLSLHAPPPAPLDPTGLLPYARRIADQVQQGRMARQWGPCLAGDPVLAIGDFNTVPGTPAWRHFMATGLVDALAGRGVRRATWPAGGGWPDAPFFALDHALTGPGLSFEEVRRVRIPGADHLALAGVLRAR